MLIYRCKLCGQTFERLEILDITESLCGLTTEDWRDINMLDKQGVNHRHNCKDGSVGIGEIVGRSTDNTYGKKQRCVV